MNRRDFLRMASVGVGGVLAVGAGAHLPLLLPTSTTITYSELGHAPNYVAGILAESIYQQIDADILSLYGGTR